MFRLIVNIGGAFDLYCSPSASDALREFVPRSNHQNNTSAILNVDTIRLDETADYGRARYILLVTDFSLSTSQRSLIRRKIESALSAEFDRIMAAKNREETLADRRRIRHVCDRFDASWLKFSKYAAEDPQHMQEDQTDSFANGSKVESKPRPARTVLNEPGAPTPPSSPTSVPPRGSTVSRCRSGGFLANAILTTIIVTIGVAVVFFFVYPSHNNFNFFVDMEDKITKLQRSVHNMEEKSTTLAYKSDVERIDNVLVSLGSNIKSLESVILKIFDTNVPNSLASSISTLKLNVSDLKQRIAYMSDVSQEGSLAYTVKLLRSEVGLLRREIGSVIDPSNPQSLVASMRILDSSLSKSLLLASEIDELETDLRHLGEDVRNVRMRILRLSDSTASGSLGHLVGVLGSEINVLGGYVSELIHTADAASLVDAVARLESNIEMLSHRTRELADATSPGSLALNIWKLEENIGYLQGELQRVASTLNEYPGSVQSSATTDSDGALRATTAEDLPDDAAQGIVSVDGSRTVQDVGVWDSGDVDSDSRTPKNGNGATTTNSGVSEDEGEVAAVVSPEATVSVTSKAEGPGNGVDSAIDETMPDDGKLDWESARAGSATESNGEAAIGDPGPDAEDSGSDDQSGAPTRISEVPLAGIEGSGADSGNVQTEGDSDSVALQRTKSSSGGLVARDSGQAAESALNLKSRDRRLVQCALNALGHYSDKLDGEFGPNTRKAIEAYEAEKKRKMTGYLTSRTSEELKEVAVGRGCIARLNALDGDSGGRSKSLR